MPVGRLFREEHRPDLRIAQARDPRIERQSSTPSMTRISMSRSSLRQGAKPTPQLPMTTVVTPCDEEGESRSDQIACPS
jgi:hypothetical protein